MISLGYRCSCGWRSGALEAAQSHADQTGHTVHVSGTISPRPKETVQITRSAREKLLEAEILRRAREKGLVRK